MHYKPNEVRCTACKGQPRSTAQHCHECGGKGFIQYRGVKCEGVEHPEAMTGGWECYDCGGSGPW